jgi:hypothetical protein
MSQVFVTGSADKLGLMAAQLLIVSGVDTVASVTLNDAGQP